MTGRLNDVALALDDHGGLRVGPILSHALDGEDAFMVGWIAVVMHGHGYLYPWRLRGLVDRAESAPGIRRPMDLCRETWPVGPGQPRRGVARARKSMGELWPGPRTDLPWDWYWGPAEG